MDCNMFPEMESLSLPQQKYHQFYEDDAESLNQMEILGHQQFSYMMSGSQNQILISSQNSTGESPPEKPKKGPKAPKNEEIQKKCVRKNLLQFYGGKIHEHFKYNRQITEKVRKEIESLKKQPSLKKLREIFQMQEIRSELSIFFEKKNLSKITLSSRCRHQETKNKLKGMGNELSFLFINQCPLNMSDIYIKQGTCNFS